MDPGSTRMDLGGFVVDSSEFGGGFRMDLLWLSVYSG